MIRDRAFRRYSSSGDAAGSGVSRRILLAGTGGALLAGCNATFPGSERGPSAPTPRVETQPLGATIGAGSVPVGLILPLGAGGNTGVAANGLKNAAEMALAEFNQPNVRLIVKDDRGAPDDAANAAREVIAEGAEMIVGPLIAATVQSAGAVARQAGRPMIAFSTDATVASRGVYLLSFMPASEVERVVGHAAAQGRRSFAALIPETAYGQVVAAEFQQAVARVGGRLVALERYGQDRTTLGEPAGRIAAALAQADALFLPEGGDAMPAVIEALQVARADLRRVKLMGAGVWNDPRVFALPALQGGWFAAPDAAGFAAFAQRYRARFGGDPIRIATLSYDAVSLVAALVRTQGTQRFSEAVLTNPSGFSGADGVFRFRTDGSNERGLAVLEVRGAGATTISPAPRSFSGL